MFYLSGEGVVRKLEEVEVHHGDVDLGLEGGLGPEVDQNTGKIYSEPRHEISNNLTSVDSDEPLQPPFKLRNSKWRSVSSLTLIEYSNN